MKCKATGVVNISMQGIQVTQVVTYRKLSNHNRNLIQVVTYRKLSNHNRNLTQLVTYRKLIIVITTGILLKL